VTLRGGGALPEAASPRRGEAVLFIPFSPYAYHRISITG
jgi:hypothetical protein